MYCQLLSAAKDSGELKYPWP